MLYLLSYKRYSGTNRDLLQIPTNVMFIADSYKCYVFEVDAFTNRKYHLNSDIDPISIYDIDIWITIHLMQCYHVL